MSVHRHTLYNLCGSLLPLVVTLVTVPLYLELIGEERYGVLTIGWLLLGYFGLFDFGLSRATAQRIARLKDASPEDRANTFWTALFVNAGLGVLGGLVLWPVASWYFSHHFRVDELPSSEILASIPWLAAAVPVATVSGVLSGTLQARERFLALNLINVVQNVLVAVLPLAVAWGHSVSLVWLIPAALAARVVSFGFMFQQCARHVPLAGPRKIDSALVLPLLRFGGWVTVTAIIVPVMFIFDRLWIGTLISAAAVTYYVIPFNITMRIKTLANSLANALFPRFAAATQQHRIRMMGEAIRGLSALITPAVAATVLLMKPFLTVWLGAEFAAQAFMVGVVIALGVWPNSLAHLASMGLQAQGRPDLPAKCHLAEVIPYIGCLTLALMHWGILGAAIVWSLRVTINALLLLWLCQQLATTAKNAVVPAALLIGALFVSSMGIYAMSTWLLAFAIMGGSLLWFWYSAGDLLFKPRGVANLSPANS